MIAMQAERERRGWSRLRLSQEARIAPYMVGQAERGHRRPYAPEIVRIAQALEWEGEPYALLEDVSEHAR